MKKTSGFIKLILIQKHALIAHSYCYCRPNVWDVEVKGSVNVLKFCFFVYSLVSKSYASHTLVTRLINFKRCKINIFNYKIKVCFVILTLWWCLWFNFFVFCFSPSAFEFHLIKFAHDASLLACCYYKYLILNKLKRIQIVEIKTVLLSIVIVPWLLIVTLSC